MIQRREDFGFALEAREPVVVSGDRRRQDLDGDLTLELRVGGAIDLPHPAFADLRGDFVDAETGAGTEGQGWRNYTGERGGADREWATHPEGRRMKEEEGVGEGVGHAKVPSRGRKPPPRGLALPGQTRAKPAVLSTLASRRGSGTCTHAIAIFDPWSLYCASLGPALNRIVVPFRVPLGERHYAPATINLRLAAVRRVAYEAADVGLLSPELAAGIRRVKGVRRLGVRTGNWLTAEQGRHLLEAAGGDTLRAVRNHAMLAMLIGCGLRRGELLALVLEALQQREGHWVIADLTGKGGHVRTVPIPVWVKAALDRWTAAASIQCGRVFRAIGRTGRVWGDGMTPKVLWEIVRAAAASAGITPRPFISGRTTMFFRALSQTTEV